MIIGYEQFENREVVVYTTGGQHFQGKITKTFIDSGYLTMNTTTSSRSVHIDLDCIEAVMRTGS